MEQNRVSKRLLIWIIAMVIWLILIYFLSSQNGPETANTSQGMAAKIAELIYKNPTPQQFNEVHLSIRRMAHVVLFFVFGVLMGQACRQVNAIMRIRSSFLFGYGFLVFCSFFDEWRKQFISGRHNNFDDGIRNLVGATIGIGIMYVIARRKK